MCKTSLLTFRGLLRNVKAIWISAKNVVYLYSEEERARKHWVLSSFFCKNRVKMGCFTKHVGKSTCLRKISTGFSGFFSGQVGAQIDDIESRKVKRYLFSNLHFFVTTQVDPDSESKCGTAVCVVSLNTNLSNLPNRTG